MKHTTSSEIFDTPNRVCRGFLNAADCCFPAASASIILNCSLWWSLKWFRKLPVLFILPFTFFEHSLHSAVTFCPVKDNGVKYFKIFGNLFESIFELFVDWFEPIIQSMSFIYQTTLKSSFVLPFFDVDSWFVSTIVSVESIWRSWLPDWRNASK